MEAVDDEDESDTVNLCRYGLVTNNDYICFDMTTRMIHLTRDSVCMADDGYEHKRDISVPSGMTVKEIIRVVWEDYLRKVGRRKWIAYSGDIYSGTQDQKLFRIDAAFPCKVDIFSGWDAVQELPDKIYFKINYPEMEIEDAEIKESFTLYRNGWLSRFFDGIGIRLLTLCLALFISSCAVPTVLIQGTVYDADGPLPYTSVYTRYPRNGVITDTAGRYSLTVPQKEGTKVYFANIGYKETVVEYSPDCDKGHLDVRMEIDSTVLFDRVVIAN